MSPGETVSRSPLDKPLNQLTEDDISQVTREDCRRYLKEKGLSLHLFCVCFLFFYVKMRECFVSIFFSLLVGMRRPSWNKSQAIQQVISLKTLLEPTTDSDAVEASKKLCIPCPENPPRVVSDSTVLRNETTQHNGISVPVNESIPCSRPDPSKSDFSGDNSGRTVISGNGYVSPRTAGVAKKPGGQMTIFYCGKVNVYDDMPGFKAEAILQLAARPVSFSQETLVDQRTAPWTIPCHLQAAGVKMSPCSPMVIFPSMQTVKVAENCHFPKEESNMSREDSLGKCFLLIIS
ncbi:hypothetical protein CRYUN_Cryun20dG0076700 [Craigia yunnanensis]